MKKIKKLASSLLIYEKTSNMEKILREYIDCSDEKKLDFSESKISQTTYFKADKLMVFIAFIAFFTIFPFEFIYFAKSNEYSMLKGAINCLTIVFPVIILLRYGKKLVIIDKFHNKSKISYGFNTLMYILFNSAVLFLVSGQIYKIIEVLNEMSVKYMELFWFSYDVLMRLAWVLMVFHIVKLFRCGISYFMPFSVSYISLIFFANFSYTFDDDKNLQMLAILFFVQYISTIIFSLVLCFSVCKKSGFFKNKTSNF